jgi:hypothetical protein
LIPHIYFIQNPSSVPTPSTQLLLPFLMKTWGQRNDMHDFGAAMNPIPKQARPKNMEGGIGGYWNEQGQNHPPLEEASLDPYVNSTVPFSSELS